MNAKVRDLMTESVITVEPDATIDRVRRILQRNKVGALPVVGPPASPSGLYLQPISWPPEGDSRVSAIMTEKVYTVPKYDDVSVAARIMRNHKIHRLVVTHEQRVVGMITTFDLLELVQGHRWVPKNPPSESQRKKRSKRL